METILYHATTIAVGAVFIVLLMGLWTMMKGTSPNLSQKLMRLNHVIAADAFFSLEI